MNTVWRVRILSSEISANSVLREMQHPGGFMLRGEMLIVIRPIHRAKTERHRAGTSRWKANQPKPAGGRSVHPADGPNAVSTIATGIGSGPTLVIGTGVAPLGSGLDPGNSKSARIRAEMESP